MRVCVAESCVRDRGGAEGRWHHVDCWALGAPQDVGGGWVSRRRKGWLCSAEHGGDRAERARRSEHTQPGPCLDLSVHGREVFREWFLLPCTPRLLPTSSTVSIPDLVP